MTVDLTGSAVHELIGILIYGSIAVAWLACLVWFARRIVRFIRQVDEDPVERCAKLSWPPLFLIVLLCLFWFLFSHEGARYVEVTNDAVLVRYTGGFRDARVRLKEIASVEYRDESRIVGRRMRYIRYLRIRTRSGETLDVYPYRRGSAQLRRLMGLDEWFERTLGI